MISKIKENDTEFVVIDYLQLIGFDKSKCLSRNKELELIKEDLKKLAKELNIKIRTRGRRFTHDAKQQCESRLLAKNKIVKT